MWWEALKFGPAGLAAIVTLWTASLLATELQREGGPRNSARKLITNFMIFSTLLTIVTLGLVIFDNTFLERDRRLDSIRGAVRSLDSGIMSKMIIEAGPLPGIDPESRRLLQEFTRSICGTATEIYHIAGSLAPLESCTRYEKKENSN
jgi:hypothetical protein